MFNKMEKPHQEAGKETFEEVHIIPASPKDSGGISSPSSTAKGKNEQHSWIERVADSQETAGIGSIEANSDHRKASDEGIGQAWSKFLKAETRRLSDRLGEVRQGVRELAQTLEATGDNSVLIQDARDFGAECADTVKLLQKELSALQRGGAAAEKTAAVAILAIKPLVDRGEELCVELENLDLDGADDRSPGKDQSKPVTLIKKILQLLRRILGKLWIMIAKMLAPKEWTLKAEFGTPLSVKGGIEIKFGSSAGIRAPGM